MVSMVLSSLVCVLCLILLPAVWAENCYNVWDSNGNHYPNLDCRNQYCCGTCNQIYCCSYPQRRLTQKCHRGGSGTTGNRSKLATLLGSILGSVFPILLCVGVVICCVAPCCLFYKKCRKGRGNRTVNHPTVIGGPQIPLSPGGNQPAYPGYQPTPVQPGFGGLPFPSAPPSYTPTGPASHPGGYNPSTPMALYPGHLLAEPPNPDDPEAQPPYNPSYPDPK